jgi:hypothetical protein
LQFDPRSYGVSFGEAFVGFPSAHSEIWHRVFLPPMQKAHRLFDSNRLSAGCIRFWDFRDHAWFNLSQAKIGLLSSLKREIRFLPLERRKTR